MSKGAKIITIAFLTIFLGVIGSGLYFFDVSGGSVKWNPPKEDPPEKKGGFLNPNTAWNSPNILPGE